jgi:hypothetical protein
MPVGSIGEEKSQIPNPKKENLEKKNPKSQIPNPKKENLEKKNPKSKIPNPKKENLEKKNPKSQKGIRKGVGGEVRGIREWCFY